MSTKYLTCWVSIAAAILWLGCGIAHAGDDAELQELKDAVRQMQQTIDGLNKKIDKLEQQREMEVAVPPPTPGAPEVVVAPPPGAEEAAEGYAENVLSSQGIGPQAPIDPALRGFFRVPYTKAMIRFNAKPRVDFTYDTKNAGDDNRFITGQDPGHRRPQRGRRTGVQRQRQGLAADHRRARARACRAARASTTRTTSSARAAASSPTASSTSTAASTTSPSARPSAPSRIPTSGRTRSTTKGRTR